MFLDYIYMNQKKRRLVLSKVLLIMMSVTSYLDYLTTSKRVVISSVLPMIF